MSLDGTHDGVRLDGGDGSNLLAQGLKPMSSHSKAPPTRGSFAELVTAARTSGHTQVLPAIAGVGIRSIPDLAARGHLALQAGVDPTAIEAIVSSSPRPPQATPSTRQDLPERHSAQRASMRAALDAAMPNSRKRALEDLDGGIIHRQLDEGPCRISGSHLAGTLRGMAGRTLADRH